MKKAFILDLNFLKEQNINPEEFLALIYLNNDGGTTKEILSSLQEKQFIKLIDQEIIIREKGKLLIDFLSIENSQSDYKNKKVNKKSDRIIQDGLDEFVDEYRLLWKGLKSGSMGSPNTCKDKLLRWMKENPKYSKEDILKAAKIYINSLDNYQYLQQADYFIYKKDGREESSRLSAFIDEVGVDNTDWTIKLS